jgi:hypothetical protein
MHHLGNDSPSSPCRQSLAHRYPPVASWTTNYLGTGRADIEIHGGPSFRNVIERLPAYWL